MRKTISFGLLLAAMAFVGAGCAKTSAPVSTPETVTPPSAVQPAVEDVLGVDPEIDALLEAVDAEDATLEDEASDTAELGSDSEAIKSFTDSTYDVE